MLYSLSIINRNIIPEIINNINSDELACIMRTHINNYAMQGYTIIWGNNYIIAQRRLNKIYFIISISEEFTTIIEKSGQLGLEKYSNLPAESNSIKIESNYSEIESNSTEIESRDSKIYLRNSKIDLRDTETDLRVSFINK